MSVVLCLCCWEPAFWSCVFMDGWEPQRLTPPQKNSVILPGVHRSSTIAGFLNDVNATILAQWYD